MDNFTKMKNLLESLQDSEHGLIEATTSNADGSVSKVEEEVTPPTKLREVKETKAVRIDNDPKLKNPEYVSVQNGIRAKKTADIDNLQPAISDTLDVVKDAYKSVVGDDYVVTITSGNDSTHKRGSKHYDDLALDFRTFDVSVPQSHKITEIIKSKLGNDYFVDNEYPGETNQHIHIHAKVPGADISPIPMVADKTAVAQTIPEKKVEDDGKEIDLRGGSEGIDEPKEKNSIDLTTFKNLDKDKVKKSLVPIKKISERKDVPANLMMALVHQLSGFDSDAEGGYFNLNPDIANRFGINPNSPADTLNLGATLFKRYKNAYGADEIAIGMFNGENELLKDTLIEIDKAKMSKGDPQNRKGTYKGEERNDLPRESLDKKDWDVVKAALKNKEANDLIKFIETVKNNSKLYDSLVRNIQDS